MFFFFVLCVEGFVVESKVVVFDDGGLILGVESLDVGEVVVVVVS